MEEIARQIKYDSSNIESKINSIKNTREKMKQWIGKPIYEGAEYSIEKWNREIIEHKKTLDLYLKKSSLLSVNEYQF